jgi:hypothetical protein
MVSTITLLRCNDNQSGIAEKEELRSNGYPFPLWEDSEFFSLSFYFYSALSSTPQLLNLYWCGQSAGVWLIVLKRNSVKLS